MRIIEKDLDSSIVKNLHQLDELKETYDINNPDVVISYDGNNFVWKKINDTYLKRIYTEDEIIAMKKALTEKAENCKSSLLENLEVENVRHKSIAEFPYDPKIEQILLCKENIILNKRFNDKIYLLDGYGVLTRLENNIVKDIVELVGLINKNFGKKLSADNVSDIEEISSEVILVATSIGIYKYNYTTKVLELVLSNPNITLIKKFDNKIIVGSDESLDIYNEEFKRLERMYYFRKKYQLPTKSIARENELFIFGSSTIFNNPYSLLHKLEKDESGINLIYSQEGLVKMLESDHHIQFIKADKNYLYFAGNYREKSFIWKYDLRLYNIKREEVILDFNINDFDIVDDSKYIILTDKNVLIINSEGKIQDKIRLCVDKIEYYDGKIYFIKKNFIGTFIPEGTVDFSTTLEFKVLDEETPCNNIDIYVDGSSKDEPIVLIDPQTLQTIKPNYYGLYKGQAIIKLLNCKHNKINMRIPVTDKSNIHGICIKQNGIFLR